MGTLTVATYNVRHAGMDDEPNSWVERRPGVVERISAADPDVLCLQESTGQQHDHLAADLPDYEWVGVAADPGSGEHNPIGYTSRVSLVDSETVWLSESGDPGSIGWDAAHARVVTVAHLLDRSTGRELTVYNTHLDHVGRRARVESVALLGELVDDLPADRPAIVVGDFNAGPGDDAYLRLLDGTDSPALVDARHAARDVSGPSTTLTDFEEVRPGRRFDHVFVGPRFGVERHTIDDTTVDGRYPSDHLPVVVDLSH